MDRQCFTEQGYSHYINNDTLNLRVPLQIIYPKVDSELLGNIRSEKIRRYETYFSEYNRERNKNIKLAAEAINNFVLFPGEIFSFNKVVNNQPILIQAKTLENKLIIGIYSSDIITYTPKKVPYLQY